MRILVTGGAGFIGSALAAVLREQGHQVVVLDNFNDHYEVSLKRDRVAHFLKDIPVVEGDIRDATLLDQLFSDNQFEVVCHLAAMAGVRYSTIAPNEYIDTNLGGLTTVLEAMRTHNCTQMVFASSSSVYGNDSNAPFTETALASAPESVYGATKRAGELLLHSYFSQYQIQSTALRFFTVYGPWSRPDMAMLKFAKKINNGQPIELYNHGQLKRDFTYISDIVAGFIAAVEKPLGYEIVNLGRGEPIELERYVSLLESVLGRTAQKTYLAMQSGDVYETYADVAKAQEKLGFAAIVSIEEGVKKFADWFQRYYA